ncbi:hypothetical protein [Rhizobium sp. FKY42]|uniref:hypothetical protein n=1 Tax=Rhizobium sp. FKY42 TaxID=2562310 RepID=UPI0010C0E4B6|nr:hypothetical protein [Rhizobium sp. FKY42]
MPEVSFQTRSCARCTLCCRLPDIDELDKPANVNCVHCIDGFGCRAYDKRPRTCREFQCDWLTDPALDDAWNPLDCHMMVYRQGAQRTVLVDPSIGKAWQQGHYASMLTELARQSEAEGGYLILFAGDEVRRIRPI